MRLYRTPDSFLVESDEIFYVLKEGQLATSDWDTLITREDLPEHLTAVVSSLSKAEKPTAVLAPIGNQEVWAAGVTYYRSRDARMQESKDAGGGDFYDRVYAADRPELFFKATAARVVGPQGDVAIRDDASWSVPEPELTLLISPGGRITGYTIGNDMSSRDIEGENPLYLPQAKVYNRSCSLGPCIQVAVEPLAKTSEIQLQIERGGKEVFKGATTLESLKREPAELVHYLYRNNHFPSGAFLLTGTGIVPPDEFTLQAGDEIRITISGIGTLVNYVG